MTHLTHYRETQCTNPKHKKLLPSATRDPTQPYPSRRSEPSSLIASGSRTSAGRPTMTRNTSYFERLSSRAFQNIAFKYQKHASPIRHHLTVEDDLITHGCRLLIPRKMRRDVLSQLHESHQGSVRTKQRAHLTVYWPGIDTDIDNTIQSCKKCQDVLPSNVREPMMTKPKPERPFQEIAGDLCSYAGVNYLILIDIFTDWPSIQPMGRDTTAQNMIVALRQAFCRTAVLDTWSDGGPQFTAKKLS